MKAKDLKLKKSNRSGYSRVTETWFMENLDGKTVQEAIEDGTIDTIDEAKLFKYHAEQDTLYFLFNDTKAVIVSEKVADLDADEVIDGLGDFTFTSGISNQDGDGKGKKWQRLGMPKSLNLGDEGISLKKEMAGETKSRSRK